MDLSMLETGRETLIGGMRDRGYSDGYIASYEAMIAFVLENNCDEWSDLDDALEAYAGAGTSASLRHIARSVLFGIGLFCEDGTLPGEGRRRRPGPTCYERLNGRYRNVIDTFMRAEAERGAKKETTIASEASCAASLLLAMQGMGRTDLGEVTETDVLGFLVVDGAPTRSKSYLKSVRTVLGVCARYGVKDAARVLALIPRPLVRSPPARGITEEEMRSVMRVIREGDVSLRDKAMALLLSTYGLRRSDVSGLRLSDVDLGASVIRVRQQKTDVLVELPLFPEVGNALCDYVIRERPRCDDPHVFQSHSRPYGRLSPGGVYCAIARLLDRAGIAKGADGRRGTHMFRHRIATSLLGEEASRPVVSGVLGHEDPRSVEAYVAADVEHLRSCALSIGAWPIPEAVFAT